MRIAQETDTVNGRVISIIALATLALTALGVIVAWRIMESTRRPIQSPPGFQARRGGPPPPELNGVEMAPFPATGTGPLSRSEAARGEPALPLTERYGWTDQSRGLVYIPIERAKELYMSRHVRSARATRNAERGGPP